MAWAGQRWGGLDGHGGGDGGAVDDEDGSDLGNFLPQIGQSNPNRWGVAVCMIFAVCHRSGHTAKSQHTRHGEVCCNVGPFTLCRVQTHGNEGNTRQRVNFFIFFILLVLLCSFYIIL